MGNTYRAHIFKVRQLGQREEVKLKLFDMDDNPIDVCNDAEPGEPMDPGDLSAHVNSETPHPVYDDGPSLALLYANAKV